MRAEADMGDVEIRALRRVITHSGARQWLGKFFGEIARRHIKRQLEGAEDRTAKFDLAIIIGAERPAEIGWTLGPIVGAVTLKAWPFLRK